MSKIKTTSEITTIKKACELGDKVLFLAIKKIEPGITEKELARYIVRLVRSNKAKLSFRPIVAFGKNTSEVHHKPTDLKLNKRHGFVMIDLGTKVQNYCSDMTRTVFLGRANKKQRKIYQTVFEAQKKSIKLAKVESKAFDIDKASRDFILKQKYPNIPHSVGHGIGKRVHEGFRISPKSKTIMKNGMVFTIEPGIYIKGYGGVRIEDTFVLSNGKLIQLTKSPKNCLGRDTYCTVEDL